MASEYSDLTREEAVELLERRDEQAKEHYEVRNRLIEEKRHLEKCDSDTCNNLRRSLEDLQEQLSNAHAILSKVGSKLLVDACGPNEAASYGGLSFAIRDAQKRRGALAELAGLKQHLSTAIARCLNMAEGTPEPHEAIKHYHWFIAELQRVVDTPEPTIDLAAPTGAGVGD